jgi:hypothetical protein
MYLQYNNNIIFKNIEIYKKEKEYQNKPKGRIK